MNEISKLASNLRGMSRVTNSSGKERTMLEKLATIALIHDQMSKHSRVKRLAAGAAGLAATGLASGTYGYQKGKKKGRTRGRREMYRAAAPHVMRARRQAAILEQIADKYVATKKASKKKLMYGAALLGTGGASYLGGRSSGRKRGRVKGRAEVAGSARRDINVSKIRAMRAAQRIRMLRSRMAQAGRTKGGK